MMRKAIHFFFLVSGIILFPADAWAFGPAAHVDFAMQIIAGAAAVAPAVLQLIQRHPDDFLWGTLSADVILGKNRARVHDHCHNWNVARALLNHAREESPAREAFALGYLNHLGADVVAHNYIIPQMLIIHYRARGVGHLYWEMRTDQRLLALQPAIRDTWQRLSRIKFADHEEFLKRHLIPTIFPNRVSTTLYKQSLHVQQKGSWRRAVARLDTRSRLLFDQSDLLLWRTLAIHSGARAIDDPSNPTLDQVDPIGRQALHQATFHRHHLRETFKKEGPGPHLEAMYNRYLRDARTVDISHFE